MRRHTVITMATAVMLASGLMVLVRAQSATPAYVVAAVNSPGRVPSQRARDAEVKPAELLTFVGIKPGDVVVDLLPGDGYYTRLLSKVAGGQGHVYPFIPLRGWINMQTMRRNEEEMREQGKKPPANPIDRVLQIQFQTEFKNVRSMIQPVDSWGANFGVPQQIDVLFAAGGYHEFYNRVEGPWRPEPLDIVPFNTAIYRAMKSGGIYVIADYAAAPGRGYRDVETLKRVEPDALKVTLMAAGFEFVAESHLWSNPNDDHTSPATDPSLGGKADRFVLKFRKPAGAPSTDNRPTGPDSRLERWDGNTFVLGKPEDGGGGLFYHTDGTLQEGEALTTWFWDADGHNCQYYETPPLFGFVMCHPFPKEALTAKPGDKWIEVQQRYGSTGNWVGMASGYRYGRGRGAGPGVPPGAGQPGAPGAPADRGRGASPPSEN